jgi:hypothetical protein
MIKPIERIRNATLIVAAALTPILLVGCIVQPAPRYEPYPQPPPPPAAYNPPPPAPEYNAPPPDYSSPPPADYSDAPPADDTAAVQTSEPPPPLPDYDQPPCPSDGYIWTPGYWRWSPAGYFWVPGTWVEPPTVGVLWTPGYWGFAGGLYLWHAGYWGPHVGFYGGVNYGYGYNGAGFVGGRWDRGHYMYNRAVNNVNVTVVHNTYVNNTVVNNVSVNRVSYNGGNGGLAAQATAAERGYAQEPHRPPTPVQAQHIAQAHSNPALFARANGGHPAIAATPRPAAFSGPGVVGARGATTSPMLQNYNRAGSANPGTQQGQRPQPARQGYQQQQQQQRGPQPNVAVPAGQAARAPQQPYVRPAPQPQNGGLAQQAQQASPANRGSQQQPRGNANGANKAPPRDNGKEHHEEH